MPYNKESGERDASEGKGAEVGATDASNVGRTGRTGRTERTGSLVRGKYREYLVSTLAFSASLYLAAIIDNIMVGNILGADELAAMNLTMPIVYVKNIVFCIFVYGGNTLAAMYRGRRDAKSADKAFTFSLGLGIACSTLLAAAGIVLAAPTASALSQGGSLYELVLAYLPPLWAVGPLVVLNSGAAAYVRTDGLRKLAIALPISSNVINLVLDYVYMAWFGWGVAGAGWATFTGYAAGSLLLVLYVRSPKRTARLVRVGLADAKLLLSLLKTGLPTALIQVCNFARTAAVNAVILGSAGVVGMQVVTICLSALNIALIFVNGSAQAVMPICGALYGERDTAGVSFAFRSSLIVTEVMCLAIMAVFMAFPDAVGRLFVQDVSGDLAQSLEVAMRLFALSIPFTGFAYILRAFYQSTKQQFAASVFTVAEGALFIIPMIYLFAGVSQHLMWLSFTFAEVLAIGATLAFMQRRARKEGKRSFLLLDGTQEDAVLDMSIENDETAAPEVVHAIIDFCAEHGIDSRKATVLGVSAEELVVNVARYAYDKRGEIDVCLRLTQDALVLRIRDDGRIFDPTEYVDDSGEEVCGLKTARQLTPDISYSRVLGFNVTVITMEA